MWLAAYLQGAAQEAYQRFQAQGQASSVIATTGAAAGGGLGLRCPALPTSSHGPAGTLCLLISSIHSLSLQAAPSRSAT